ncbi:biotin synthase BioB [Euryhalocaulis caribicus]|uniref:biotin synthase BioB n=1 Tax=Euryhalocaulis caribicus TaxID=1161401 RepID=UPI0003A8FA38|nr:biotin synthase BioB [Euryhalocaulis caribicus]
MDAPQPAYSDTDIRTDWTRAEAEALYRLPFSDLVFRAASVHRAFHDPGKIERAQLLSIKTGGCAEDCGYCSQSAKFDTGVKASKLMDKDSVMQVARAAKAKGADRFCMGAAWRSLKDRDVEKICDIVTSVKAEGLETCMTLGMLEEGQAERLADAGLDFYNHNLDTSREYYDKVITTRTYDDRLETLGRARKAGVKLCVGGILGLGEDQEDRVGLLLELSRLDPHPESVPVNRLVPVKGTPLAEAKSVKDLDFIRTVALARLMMPKSVVRLSAGRETMSETMQALCFLAGANSIFMGEALLTAPNAGDDADSALLAELGLNREAADAAGP